MTLDVAIIDGLGLDQEIKLELVDGRYEIQGFDEFKSKVEEVLKRLSDHEFSEDDRSSLASTRAAVNKYSKSVSDMIKSVQTKTFGRVEEQRKESQTLLSEITAALKSLIDEADRLARLRKQEIFESELHREIEYVPELSGLDIFDIIDASWTNRSASDKKSLKEMHDRMNTISKLIKSDLCMSTDASEICAVLQLHDWSELDTIEFIRLKYAPVEEIAESAASKDSENAADAIEENSEEREIVSLEIKSKDFERLIEILKVSEIDYRIV